MTYPASITNMHDEPGHTFVKRNSDVALNKISIEAVSETVYVPFSCEPMISRLLSDSR